MCGIVGSFPEKQNLIIKNSLEEIKHRGPDDQHIIHTPLSSLGHARLSIIDVTHGHQPMRHEDSWIVFNGEVYNFLKIRALIPNQLKTLSDTEVILHLYKMLGPDCVSMLDGMFAFAIVDDHSIFLARDPLGIKPLYYVVQDQILYFASEMKALKDISPNIEEFPAGHWWHSELGIRQYHHLISDTICLEHSGNKAIEDQLPRIHLKLQQAVEKRMIADESVPVGVSLSGGLDSSIVAAFAREIKPDLDTFVVGVSGGEDINASIDVANFLGTTHHIYKYSLDEMVSILPEVIYHLESYDAPLIRSSIPNFFLAKLASEHVKVILTGEGADELFAGYKYLEDIENSDELQSELILLTKKLQNTNLQRADRMSMAHGLEARVPFLDKDFVDLSLALPAEWKLRKEEQVEKQLLRDACEGLIPDHILKRPKSKFSDGAGSINYLSEYANQKITDDQFLKNETKVSEYGLRSKEELLYFQIFEGMFGTELSSRIEGRTRSITESELQ
ncbi:MAG TPA: asparagine synthase B [Anaerolineales bacterium]|nr:asparagine synthase B [Anaerolineales bacterium]